MAAGARPAKQHLRLWWLPWLLLQGHGCFALWEANLPEAELPGVPGGGLGSTLGCIGSSVSTSVPYVPCPLLLARASSSVPQ